MTNSNITGIAIVAGLALVGGYFLTKFLHLPKFGHWRERLANGRGNGKYTMDVVDTPAEWAELKAFLAKRNGMFSSKENWMKDGGEI